ncbi:MAG: Rrf2 family transcriptional regulator [Clostridia bacterium]|nr:Rrf2 family transcriptional regulator [Clostridia bacterium]
MISTRGRYALRMMADLAQHQKDGFVSLKDIAQRQEISKKYLEQIIPILNRAALLQTSRGSAGGYRLVKPPREYTVREILCATEGTLAPVSCLEGEVNTCPRCGECATLFVWEGLQKVETEYLNSITLQDILDKQAEKAGNNYSI